MDSNVSPRILVIRLSSLGDVVLASSVPAAIRARAAGARISFLTKEKFRATLEGNPHIDEILSVEASRSSSPRLFALGRALARQRFDLVVDLQSNPRSLLLSLLASPRDLVTAKKDSFTRHGMVRVKRLRPRRSRHAVQRYLSAVEKALGPVPAFRPRMYLSQAESERGRALLSGRGDDGGPWVGICPGARWQTKIWGVEKTALLAEELLRAGLRVAVMGGGPDEPVLAELRSVCAEQESVVFVDSDLRTLASVMSWCDCVVSNDSGLMHLAHSVGVPVVAIFGPTVPEFGFYPPDSGSVVLSNEFDCKPCDVHGTETCKEGDLRCMESVKVRDVLEAVTEVLERGRSPGGARRRPEVDAKGFAAHTRLEQPVFWVVGSESSLNRRRWKIPGTGPVGVRVPNWVGDAVMARPALAALRKNAGRDRMTLIADSRVAGLFEDGSLAQSLFVLQRRTWPGLLRDALRLRKLRMALGVTMADSFSSALLLWLGGAGTRVGFRGEAREPMLSVSLERPRWLHLCEEYAHLLPEGVGLEGVEPLAPFEADLRRVESLLVERGVTTDSRLVVLAPGAAYGETKRWPAEHFVELSGLLKRLDRVHLVIVGAEPEKELCERIATESRVRAVSLAGETTLRELVAVSSMAAVFVGNDSGAAHVASAAGCPVVVIVGSSDPSWTTPRGPAVEVVYNKLSCSPCFLQECPYSLECLTEVKPEQVYEATLRVVRTMSFGLHSVPR